MYYTESNEDANDDANNEENRLIGHVRIGLR